MIWRRLALAALAVPSVAAAQFPPQPPRRPAAPDTGLPAPVRGRRPASDTTATDTSKAPRELVKWGEPDSVMNALLNRQGYTITRYQGADATFNATHHTLTLSGQGAVQREQMILVADTIFYNDSSKIVRAAAAPKDTIVLRDPSQGTSDLVALGGLQYDIAHRRGIGREISTSSVQAGQTWFIFSDRTGFHGDTTGKGGSVSYAEDGSITSCDLPYPHYHFQAAQIKMVTKHLMVARPAVLYIADIPVLWLPFIFQDMRKGRRSGIIPPRFGLSDIVRTSAGYTREVDNLGYYFALNDYMDALVSLDWRSGNSSQQGNVGYTRYNGMWNYRWLDRFLSGAVATSYIKQTDGATIFNLAWRHQQQFSQTSSLNTNINYSSNTTAIQNQAFTVVQALAAIASSLNFQQALGPANISLGGTRTQYTGRRSVDQNFPNLTITAKPVNVTSWLLWSPGFSLNNTQNFHMQSPPIPQVYVPRLGGTGFDSVAVDASQRTTAASFQTPFRIAGFTWQNSFQINDHQEHFPEKQIISDINTGQPIATRVYASRFDTRIDWQTGIGLPSLLQGTLNLAPSVSVVNADPGLPFLGRTTFSGGRFVTQSKTLQYALSSSPTLFGFFPGFGPFTRIRHSIQPRLTFAYAPASHVSDDVLRAYNMTRAGYLGNIPRGTVSLQLDQVIEAKLRSTNDTNPDAGQKIKLLMLSLSPITYDFERAHRTGRSGITSTEFSYHVASDLLPGFDLTVNYSLYQGSIESDTARFKPFRTGLTASFTIGQNNNPITAISHLFGSAAPESSSTTGATGQGINQSPAIAGPASMRYPMAINTSGGWTAQVSYSSTRSRPIAGATVIDPRAFCQQYINFPLTYQRCLATPIPVDTLEQHFGGGQAIIAPPQATLRGNLSFKLTPKWSMQWTTGYDFVLHDFSDQSVTLQRDMHDWRALMGFNRAPNGNFMFNFYISLKAEPDLKFDYNRNTYRPPSGTPATP